MKGLEKKAGWVLFGLFFVLLMGLSLSMTACSTKSTPTASNNASNNNGGGGGGGNNPTVLAAGDVAFVAFASRSAINNDQFAAVILKAIGAGTTIIFTTADSTSDGSGFQSSESNLTWVASRGFPAGSIFEIFDASPTPVTVFSSGTAYDQTANVTFNGTFGMSKNGDNLFAIQGSLGNPAFLAGIVSGGNGNTLGWGGTDDNGRVEYLPPSLTSGTTANSLGSYSHGYYDCSKTTTGTEVVLDSAINGGTVNWTGLADTSNTDLNQSGDVLSCTIVPQ